MAATVFLTGCMAISPLSSSTLILKPCISAGSYSTQTVVSPYTQASIEHLVLKLFTVDTVEHDTGIQKTLYNADLNKSVVFSNLRTNTHYRIKALAYTAGNVQISTDDANSYTDVILTTDDAPTISPVKVRLIDIGFNGQGTSSLSVTPGGYSYAASESLVGASWVTTLAGNGVDGTVDNQGTAAQLAGPSAVAFDNSGNLLVADYNGNRIRMINPQTRVVTTIAGSGAPNSVDGTGTLAQFQGPIGLAVDATGNIYVAEWSGCRIRKIDPNRVVTTLAGSGAGGQDGTGTAAQFKNPYGIALDAQGNLFVGDCLNHRIRKVTPQGVVSTFAGNATGGHLDGQGSAAQFKNPAGVAFDASGNLYVADHLNHRIRKITPSGSVSTLAGDGATSFRDGQGTQAQFWQPRRLVVDAANNLYLTDGANNRIRKITSAGLVTTVAGDGSASYLDGAPLSAQFNVPDGIAMDANGILYIGDRMNNRIRRLSVN